MHTIGSGNDSGVIAAPAAPAADTSPIAPAAPASVPDATLASAAQQGPITDIPLPQLPPDTPPASAPAFTTARKEFEDNGSHGIGAPHLPGGGSGAPDAGHAHAGVLGDAASPLLGAGHDVVHQAAGALGGVPGAQHVLDGAQAALNQAPAALDSAAGAVQQAAAPVTAAVPANLPPMPADPVAALMSGMALPALPGIDVLFKPFLDLLSSFGTGVMGALNPADLLSQSSQVIQSAMQIGMGAMKSVEQVWQGQSATSAQTAGQQVQAHGEDASQRGFDISKLTDEAAAVVQRGNVQLTQVVQSFATQAGALAPVAFTPPGQATLIAAATEHLGQAVTIVNATRGELGGYTGQLANVVNQLAGQYAPQAADAAQAVAQNVGQPIVEQAQSLLSGGGADTQAAGLGDLSGSGLSGASTHASAFGGNGAHPGSMSGTGGGALSGLTGGLGGTASGGGAAAKPGLGSAVPGTRPGIPGMPFGPGMPGTPGQGTPGSGFMGGGTPGAAGQRNADEDRGRTVQNYQSLTGNTDLTGPLGETTPEVIGQTHSDELISDYENDQL
ncbi:hypothetical protein IRT45_06420 [Nocardia sp. BSTN01]|uniref:hypothetical protein n=1 Tax=Nocardia sp. BSTN01 TaxID=2783665 RepID=UPI001890A73F|nr:hypothetical protein [Nocardia sp. BSTN01]MBF4996788.1 hypothetical protein [Nocardia sp. BSTN01]